MKRHAPQVRDYMTHLPVEAEKCETAEDVVEVMRSHGIHHIPVVSGSHLRGMLSRLELAEAHIRLRETFAKTPLDQLCKPDTLLVSPVDPIDEVARKMLKAGKDGAAVVDGGFVVGVFTATDALRFIDDFFGQTRER